MNRTVAPASVKARGSSSGCERTLKAKPKVCRQCPPDEGGCHHDDHARVTEPARDGLKLTRWNQFVRGASWEHGNC
jgi:hypothetical protein